MTTSRSRGNHIVVRSGASRPKGLRRGPKAARACYSAPVRRLLPLMVLLAACGSSPPGGGRKPTSRVVQIDIDDHGLAGLWMANAPNIKGLIAARHARLLARGRPDAQQPEQHVAAHGAVPRRDERAGERVAVAQLGFAPPVELPGLVDGRLHLLRQQPAAHARRQPVPGRAARRACARAYFGSCRRSRGRPTTSTSRSSATSLGSITVDAAAGEAAAHDGPALPAGRRRQLPPRRTGRGRRGRRPLHHPRRRGRIRPAPTRPTRSRPTCSSGTSSPSTTIRRSQSGASGPAIVQVVEEYDAAIGEVLRRWRSKALLDDTNILFTLDHGKVDTHNQVVLGTHGQDRSSARRPTGSSARPWRPWGPRSGSRPPTTRILNEDGDAQIYARVDGAGTPAGAARQQEVTHALLTLDPERRDPRPRLTRTMTADGAMGTRRFHDLRGSGPNQADIVVFPVDDWTLNQVDATNATPGPFVEHARLPLRTARRLLRRRALRAARSWPGRRSSRACCCPHPVEHPEVARRRRGRWASCASRRRRAARSRGARGRSRRGGAAARGAGERARGRARGGGLRRRGGARRSRRDGRRHHRRRRPLRRRGVRRPDARRRGGAAAARWPPRARASRTPGRAAATAGHRVPVAHRRLPGRATVDLDGRGRSRADRAAGRGAARDAATREPRRQSIRATRPGAQPQSFPDESLFAAARAAGLTTALIGQPRLPSAAPPRRRRGRLHADRRRRRGGGRERAARAASRVR